MKTMKNTYYIRIETDYELTLEKPKYLKEAPWKEFFLTGKNDKGKSEIIFLMREAFEKINDDGTSEIKMKAYLESDKGPRVNVNDRAVAPGPTSSVKEGMSENFVLQLADILVNGGK